MEIAFVILVGAMILHAAVAILHRRGWARACRSLLILIPLAAIYIGVPQFPRRMQTALSTNVAQTSPDPEFPELKARFYSAPRQRVFQAAVEAVRSLRNWRLVSAEEATGVIRAEKRVLVFTDDVV